MPSLQQVRATSGRGAPIRIEDINQARLPSLYASRSQALSNQQADIAERELGLGERGLALRAEEADIMAGQSNRALLTQGLNTGISGAALVETAYPGALRSLGQAFLPKTAGAVATAPALAATAPLAAPAAGALEGGTGLSAAYPLFGGASEAALSAAAPATTSATAAGVGAADAAALGAASTLGPTVAPTLAGTGGTAAAGTAGAAAGAGGATLGGALGPLGLGFAAGSLAGRPLGQLFGLKGRAAGAVGGAVAGAGSGALTGLIGGPFAPITVPMGALFGGLSGALAGGISIIATVTYGPDSPQTRLAQQFRRNFVGPTTYAGYRALFDPLAQYLEVHPEAKASVRKTLVDPMIRAMKAELWELPADLYQDERARLKALLKLCRNVGKELTHQTLKKGASHEHHSRAGR